jgi:hypothetical protein
MDEKRKDIKRLAAHYRDLQGLRLIPMGLFFGLAAISSFQFIPWSDYVYGGLDQASSGLVVILVAMYLAISAYYNRQYGAVKPGPVSAKKRIFGIALWIAFLVAIVTFRLLDPPVNTIMLVLATGVCLESLDGSRRYGRLYLGLAIGAFALLPVFTGKPDSNYFIWFNSFMALGFLSVGIAEHVTFRNLIASVNRAVAFNG